MNNKKNKIYIIFYQLGLNKDVINIIFRKFLGCIVIFIINTFKKYKKNKHKR